MCRNCGTLKEHENLQEAIEDVQFGLTWDQFKVYNAGVEVLGRRKRKHHDWFDENDRQISKFLEDRHKVHQQ